MADKPSRALVLYGDGLARFISPAHTHLHSFASRASCGFLALPHGPPAEAEEMRLIREFAELLDSNEAYKNLVAGKVCELKSPKKCSTPTITERFMGMKAAIFANNLSLKSFGGLLGLKVFNLSEICGINHTELLALLGFQEGRVLENSDFDVVFVDIKGSQNEMNGLEEMELVNQLVGDLLRTVLSEAEYGSRLHISVILSYGATLEDDHLKLSVSDNKTEKHSELGPMFPRQSYMMKAGKPRENVRNHSPMLLAQYQNAVTRKDMVESFTFSDFLENCGDLVIPADRFIHEVAFKLWKAPKYGA